MKTLLYFGIYDRNYSRTKIIQQGFTRNGWEVDECNIDPTKHTGIRKYFTLVKLGIKARTKKFDLVLVGYPGNALVVFIARVLFGGGILFDAFLSQYDSNVLDRKKHREGSLAARFDKINDRWSTLFARKVLLDTDQHIEYFVRLYKLPREKFIRVWIGADDTIFHPLQISEDTKFTVHFHGTFIPLQGIRYIVEAADILRNEEIFFRIIGSGQEREKIETLIKERKLTNIELVGKVPVMEIPRYIAKAHITLGIFGDTEKTQRVIPNKVYEQMAMGKCIITADTPAIGEFPGLDSALSLVSVADPQALADAIRALRDSPEKRRELGAKAREVFVQECLPEHMIAGLLKHL